MKNERDFSNDVKVLKKHLGRLINLTRICLLNASNVVIDESNDFAFVAMLFLNKQLDHAESLRLLLPRRDTCLIARSMFDGDCRLQWIAQDPIDRARRWRAFSFVHDFHIIKDQISRGQSVSEVDQARIDSGIKEFGNLFRKQSSDKQETNESFYKFWHGNHHLSEMAEAIGAKEFYDQIYDEMSEWEHWTPAGLGDAVTRSGIHISYTIASQRVSALSLWVAFNCLSNAIYICQGPLLMNTSETLASVRTSLLRSLLQPDGVSFPNSF